MTQSHLRVRECCRVPPLLLQFVLSAPSVDALPETTAEIAVAGRSNVGKSSLVNALAARRDLAQVSGTPGRTRLLNLFSVATGGTLVDLPGYGYAKASHEVRRSLSTMVREYLLRRDGLVMVVVLVDGEVGPTALDLGMLAWLREEIVPHTVVATKHDKVKSSQRERRKRDVAAACSLEPGDVVWVSAQKGTGIDRLRGLVHLWLGG